MTITQDKRIGFISIEYKAKSFKRIFEFGIREFNRLSIEYKNCKSLNLFKYKVKNYLLKLQAD